MNYFSVVKITECFRVVVFESLTLIDESWRIEELGAELKLTSLRPSRAQLPREQVGGKEQGGFQK